MDAARLFDPPFGEQLAVSPARADGDQRIVLNGLTWRDYCVLRELLGETGARMTYLAGSLELMSPGRLHEDVKKRIARLLELWALEHDVALYGYGSVTLRLEARERGVEPDECYAVGSPMAEYPDLALEVVVSHGGLDKLEVYRSMGVREVWRWDTGRIFVLVLAESGAYEARAASVVLAGIDLESLARHASNPDQHAALRAFWGEIRAGQ